MKNIKYEAESVLMDSSGNLKRFTGKLYYDKVRLNNYKWYGKDDSMRIYATYHYDWTLTVLLTHCCVIHQIYYWKC